MTFQFLTLSMIEKAKSNGRFIDQTEFKTPSKYLFDTLIITDDVMKALDLYITHVRKKLSPKCNYLLLSTNGSQFKSLTTAMTMLVNEAIGKYINPTRYRQIIETESGEKLSRAEQEVISEDQKHSSTVAKIHYKKKQSRVIAIEGKRCMDKMTKDSRCAFNSLNILSDIDDCFDSSVLDHSKKIIEQDSEQLNPFLPYSSSSNTITKPVAQNVAEKRAQELHNASSTSLNSRSSTEDDIEMTITKSIEPDLSITGTIFDKGTISTDVEIKREVAFKQLKKSKNIKFSKEEDFCLKQGIETHGRKNWAVILKDEKLSFDKSRTRDSLRMRAESAAFKRFLSKS